MRQKMITLCPTTYEIAKKMNNFSGWIRQELMKKYAMVGKAKPDIDVIYGAWCEDCDVTFTNKTKFLIEYSHYCTKCHEKTKFLGEVQ